MGPEYTTDCWQVQGNVQRRSRVFHGFVLAFTFVYLCIAAQFESWLHPHYDSVVAAAYAPLRVLSLLLFGHQNYVTVRTTQERINLLACQRGTPAGRPTIY